MSFLGAPYQLLREKHWLMKPKPIKLGVYNRKQCFLKLMSCIFIIPITFFNYGGCYFMISRKHSIETPNLLGVSQSWTYDLTLAVLLWLHSCTLNSLSQTSVDTSWGRSICKYWINELFSSSSWWFDGSMKIWFYFKVFEKISNY